MEQDHRAADALDLVQRRAGLVGRLGGRPGTDQAIEVARLEAMIAASEGRQVGDGIAAGPGPDRVVVAERRQHGEASGAAALHGDALGAGLSRSHQGPGGGRAVGHIDHAPLTVEPLAVGPPETGGTAVVHIHHAPAPAGPELDRQAQSGAGHGGGAAVTLHQQGRFGVPPPCRRVVPGLGGQAAVTFKPEILGLADGDRLQGIGGGWLMAPAAAAGVEIQQARAAVGGGGQGYQAAVLSIEGRQIVEGQVQRLPEQRRFSRCGWRQPPQVPAAVTAGRRQQLLAIPDGGAHAVDPLGHGELCRHRQQRLPVGFGIDGQAFGPVEPLQVPPAAAVIGHHQIRACPEGLKDRDRFGLAGV